MRPESRNGAVGSTMETAVARQKLCNIASLGLSFAYNSTLDHRNASPWTVPLLLVYFRCMSACVSLYHCLPRQWLGKHVSAATNTHATVEQLLDGSLSMQSVFYLREVHPGTPSLPTWPPAKTCWSLPAQSLLVWSLMGLTTIVDCLTGLGAFRPAPLPWNSL
jgi:hypothetical protein